MTKAFLGGSQGDGQQKVSWVHIEDFCRAVEHIINDKEMDGAVNITAPYPIANKDFMALMRKKYDRSFGIGQSRSVLELGALLIGTEAELLLKSRNVYPEKLLLQGFRFLYPELSSALKQL